MSEHTGKQMVDRHVLEQLSGASTADYSVTLHLPRFVWAEAIDHRKVTVASSAYVPGGFNGDYSPFDPFDDSDEGGVDRVTRYRDLGPSATANYFARRVLPEGSWLERVSTEQVPLFIDQEHHVVYFTGLELSVAAMRNVLCHGMYLGRTRYSTTSNSGKHKTAAALRRVSDGLYDELRLDEGRATPSSDVVLSSDNSYCVPRGRQEAIQGKGTTIYLWRGALSQESIDREIEQQNVPGLAEARVMGLPTNVEIFHRVKSGTGCSKGWVIRPDGTDREPDEITGDPRRVARYGEGTHVWRQILPGELVVRWGKGNAASAHEFGIVYQPDDLSDAQLRRVAAIQQELEDTWSDRRGLSSRLPSPPVGNGWGISDTPTPSEPSSLWDSSESKHPDGGTEEITEITPEVLDALKKRFNG